MEENIIQRIKKRSGEIVIFDKNKVSQAIFAAARSVGKADREMAEQLTEEVIQDFKNTLFSQTEIIPEVENIQDLVEKKLVEKGFYKIAKAYIIYRYKHANLRNTKKIFSNMDLVDNYLSLDDWRVKENANMAYSLQGLNFHLSSIISAQYWMNRIYDDKIKNAHESGDLHIHDLGTLSVYCVGWDLKDLLMTGFKGVAGKIASKPAKHFKTALGQIVNFFYTTQGESAGAQAFSNFDTLLAPFIAYDNLTYKQVKQYMQEFLFNMNVPTRVGFQTPFTNITMDMKVPEFMKYEPVVIGGKLQEGSQYADYQKEMDMINKIFAELMCEGDANGRVFTFPIPTYNITKDFDWNNKELDAVWEMTSKYGIPNFSNFVNSDLSPDDVRSMCCRLRLDKKELQKRGGGLFGANPLTGSIGVVTINMPRIGYLAKSQDEFLQRLEKQMDIAKESLEIKRKLLENLTEKGLYPYSKFYLRHLKQRNNQYWKNHFSTIGLVGMNEACLNFLGKSIATSEGNEFTKKILDFMRNKMQVYQEETDNLYNLEASPAEGTSYSLARKDKELYSDIIFANQNSVLEGGNPYYTNSTQLPVNFTDDLFEALELQDEIQTKYTGGTNFHIFVGEKQLSHEAIKALIQKVTKNYELPYFTLSPTFSVCPEHGYQYGEEPICSKCASEGKETVNEVYSRIVGYLRPVSQWNNGKKAEFEMRSLFDKEILSLKTVNQEEIKEVLNEAFVE